MTHPQRKPKSKPRLWTAWENNLLNTNLTDEEVAEKTGRTVTSIAVARRPYRRKKYMLKLINEPAPIVSSNLCADAPQSKVPVKRTDLELPAPQFGRLPLDVTNSGDWIRLGLVADTHLCCKEERLEALHNHYDLMAAEGITTVFHAGNIVDGYIQRINGDSVFDSTIDGQAQYVIDNYPHRDGMTTHFITGDDHESWFAKGFNFGAYLMLVAREQGRNDLNYIGHVEADVEVKTGAEKPTIIKIQHPGGGSAYSRSYTGQKTVESLQGGEKPAILVQGHYHVSNFMSDRNVYVIGLPGFQDQTIFARKKRLRMEVGGAILEFKVNPDDGAVTRCRLEFNLFFDRGYYKRFLKSDSKIVKGHLTLHP